MGPKSTNRGRPLAGRLSAVLRAGARDERGAVAVFFAVALVVLIPLVLGAVDIYMATVQRSRLQDALDAAALYVARSSSEDPAVLTTLGQKALAANIKLIHGAHLSTSSFKLVGNKIVASAVMQPMTIASNLWPHGDMTVGTEVVRSSMNLEVALVLDITGSMDEDASGGGGKKIDALKAAAGDLIDLVVQDSQTPYYSKVALVPYSNSVNVGSYVSSARGTAVAAKTVTSATWKAANATSYKISGATKANPLEITANNHTFAVGDWVYVDGVKGMTQINDAAFKVTWVSGNKFRVSDGVNVINSSNYSNYSSNNNNNGYATKCAKAYCVSTITANSHGFANGDYVRIGGLALTLPTSFSDNLNDKLYVVANASTNSFDITGSVSAGYTTATGGKAWCTNYGCEYYRFDNAAGGQNTYVITNCVTERANADAFTDASTSGSYVGAKYQEEGTTDNTACPGSTITPLSSSKTNLKAYVNAYSAVGYTAGHIGLAWGWYAVSPNFSAFWPSGSQGASYDKTDVLKVVVLMTDGQFNTANYNGVISKDSTSAGSSDRINTNAVNGDAFTQARKLCDEMHRKKIVIYTVGFDIGNDASAKEVMSFCATDADHAYLPSSGTAIKTAFKAIAQDINMLRLSH